jgi:hypothetical protein
MICCNLEIHFLPAIETEFVALSYTWGSTENNAVIHLDDGPVPVTMNLLEALQALRFQDKSRVLWIDALCINQTDLEERASQVNIMRHIYQKAQNVIVWLGPAADDSRLAFDLLATLSNVREQRHTLCRYGVILREQLPQLGLPDFLEPHWAALNSLLSRSWFSRVWVIQEVAVSKNCIVRCGNCEISWAVMANAARTIHEAQLMVVLNEGYKHVCRLQAFRECIAAGKELPLVTLLLSNQACLSTDPRDKIFAMLGISSDVIRSDRAEGLPISPNYRKTAAEVFTESAKSCIDYFDTLDILAATACEPKESKVPSWVPDWSKALHCTPLMVRENTAEYRTSRGCRARCEYSENCQILHIFGIVFDRVAEVGKALIEQGRGQDIDDVNIQTEWAEIAEKLKSYPGNDSVDMAYFRTLIANTDSLGRKANDDYGSAFLAWYRWLYRAKGMEIPEYLREDQLNPAEENTRATLFNTAVMRVCYGRRYFLTTGGYMGIGPAAMKVDDVICVARGASVPLVLREIRKFVGDGLIQPFNAHYERRLVGEAYVHGVMDGEAYNEGQLEKIILS